MVTLEHVSFLLAKSLGINSPTAEDLQMFRLLALTSYSTIIKRDITRHNNDSLNRTRVILELVEAPLMSCKTYCHKVVRTKTQIPMPIKYPGKAGFELVSSPELIARLQYNYVAAENLEAISYQGRMGNQPFYSLINQYLYVFYQYTPELISVTDIWPDPAAVVDICYTPDTCSDKFPLPADLVNEIIGLAKITFIGNAPKSTE